MAVDDVIRFLHNTVEQSDEVIKSTARNAGLSTFIKNSVNNLTSNEGMVTKTVSKQGRKAAQKAVQNLSESHATQKTAQKAVDNLNSQLNRQVKINNTVKNLKNNARTNSTQGTANKYQDFVDNIKNNQQKNRSTRGNRAKERSVNMQTAVNNVMDSRGTVEISEGNSRKVSERINQAVENIQNPKSPINPQASPFINNTPIDRPMPNSGYGPRVGVEPETPRYGPTVENAKNLNNKQQFENNFDFSNDGGPNTNSSGGNNGNKTYNNFERVKFDQDKVWSDYTRSKDKEWWDRWNADHQDQGGRWKDFAEDYFGGIGDTINGVRDGGNFWDALQAAHTNEDGSLRWSRAIGSYAAASVGARVISGGGLYKDRYGNSNIPGVPFI